MIGSDWPQINILTEENAKKFNQINSQSSVKQVQFQKARHNVKVNSTVSNSEAKKMKYKLPALSNHGGRQQLLNGIFSITDNVRNKSQTQSFKENMLQSKTRLSNHSRQVTPTTKQSDKSKKGLFSAHESNNLKGLVIKKNGKYKIKNISDNTSKLNKQISINQFDKKLQMSIDFPNQFQKVKNQSQEQYFSYTFHIENHIFWEINQIEHTVEQNKMNSTMNSQNFWRYKKSRESKVEKNCVQKGKQYLKDLQMLLQNFDRNSIITTIKNIEDFKKNSKYFGLKLPQIRILYHCVQAEICLFHKDLEKAIQEFHYAEYHARKHNFEHFTIYFLWEISTINMYAQKNQQSINALKNLIQMAVVLGNKNNAIKYAFQRISLLFYYRGNSLIGSHYFRKSQDGLSAFQEEIYFREYSKTDELQRLQRMIFNESKGQVSVKMKNNPKIEEYINKDQIEGLEKKYQDYINCINSMLKTQGSSKQGLFIKNIMKKNSTIGEVKNPSRKQNSLKNSSNFLKNQKKIDNFTRVIKTHLSLNRQNFGVNRQGRWKKFQKYLFSLMERVSNTVEQHETSNTSVKWNVSKIL